MTRHIIVIGAGFSGALTAVNLLRHAGGPLRVTLLNRSGRMARGLAYGTASTEHLLNVPAGNMSALADEPDDFLRYCRWANPRVQPSTFVSRRLYGSYLEALLDAAEHGVQAGVVIERITGEAERVAETGSGVQVELADGRQLLADQVVFAFGHFAPRTPHALAPLAGTGRYLGDPWAHGSLEHIGTDTPVLLIGSGLTAMDAAIVLHRHGVRQAPVWLLSRRGLLPQPHRECRGMFPPEAAEALVAGMGRTVRSSLRSFREAVQRHAATGGDWRDVMAALRPHTAAIWHRFDGIERRRFLRHLQPFWDAARHRCAPAAHEEFQRWIDAGTVRRLPGRLVSCRPVGDGVEVAVTPRGGSAPLTLHVSTVVNCTGAEADLRRVNDPLVQHLLRSGLACPDEAGIGIDVDEHGALKDAHGGVSERLYYVGPLLRARDWEATAVPELRQLARRLALHLLSDHGFSLASTCPTLGEPLSPLERWPAESRVV
jgi:uncharacterized NAD(P)/FAD-binding protein YdhS